MTDKEELRRLAQAATPGPWEFSEDAEAVSCEQRWSVGRIPIANVELGWDEPFDSEQRANGEFIAAANPATVLELLDEIELIQSEVKEQARLLGMSAERELKLLAEIERLRRYIDVLHGKDDVRHRYDGLCPDETQPDSRDDECPACLLLGVSAEKEQALTSENKMLEDTVLTLGTELRAVELALDDERINLTHTAAQVAAEMRGKINELHAEIQRLISERNAFGLAIDRAISGSVPDEHPLRSRLVEIAAMRAQPAQSAQDEWIDPNDKTQARYLPHIGEPVLFSHKGRVHYGKHTGGSFTAGAGVSARQFVTWDCMWRPIPAAPAAQGNNDED